MGVFKVGRSYPLARRLKFMQFKTEASSIKYTSAAQGYSHGPSLQTPITARLPEPARIPDHHGEGS